MIIQDALDTLLSLVSLLVNGRDQRSTLQAIFLNCAQFVLDENVVAINRIVISARDVYPEIADIFYAEGVERVPVTLAAWLSMQRDCRTINFGHCHTATRMLLGMVTWDFHRDALLGRRLPPQTKIASRAELYAKLFLDGCAVPQSFAYHCLSARTGVRLPNPESGACHNCQ